MRVAVLSDIHGNLPALEAALEAVRAARVDRIVVGGDVLPGPMPRETFARLRALDTPVDYIYGNGEVAVLEQLSGKVPRLVPESYQPVIRWDAEQLGAGYRDILAAWPLTLRLTVPPLGDVLFCHATPRNENEIFMRTTPEDRLRPVFDPAHADVVVCGHTHMQFDRMVGQTRVVNAGSVGMPFGRTGVDWLLLGPGVHLEHTTYDIDATAERFRRSGCPLSEEFFIPTLLRPQTEEQMLQVYSGAELA